MGFSEIFLIAMLALFYPVAGLAGILYMQKHSTQFSFVPILKNSKRAQILFAFFNALSVLIVFVVMSYELCPSGIFAMECFASAAIIFVTNFFSILLGIRLIR
ncbi:MAG: hypothetical protein RBT47_10070 [Anaerolineae bacterium]|nr:hypothetical protein [Anaerolineae bacterium]